MAIDADKAVGIVRQRESLPRQSEAEKSLFSLALERQLKIAESDEATAARIQAWRYAGVIVRFSEIVGIPVELPERRSYSAEQLHASALRELHAPATGHSPKARPRDLLQHAFSLHAAARDLRLAGDLKGARRLAWVSEKALYGSGAEPHFGHLMFEVGAAIIQSGQAAQVEDALREKDGYWTKTRAVDYSTRYRVDFIRAVGQWETGDARAAARLEDAVRRAGQGARSIRSSSERGLERLSVTLANAEYLASRARSSADQQKAARLGHEALDIAEGVRNRWRVIARSRAPLAIVFHRVYGDIALLAASLRVPEAAALGLRVALSAKQTGFAARMRSGGSLMNKKVKQLIDEIVDLESSSAGSGSGALNRLRFELQEAVSPMLADTVIPLPRDLETVTGLIGARYALDYQELPDSLAGPPNLFRTLVRPGPQLLFERLTPDEFHAAFFRRARKSENLATLLDSALDQRALRLARDVGRTSHRDLSSEFDLEGTQQNNGNAGGDLSAFDWLTLAEGLLPAQLRDDLGATRERPVELLISAHSWLCLVPWPALEIAGPDGKRVRLVERANVTQTPVFTCLQPAPPAPVTGRALIRLVGRDEHGVDVSKERAAWGLDETTDGVPWSACGIAGSDRPKALSGTLADALGGWGFIHIAAHGDGRELEQRLDIPGDSLSFGRALELKWPGAVLMASCHVGQVINEASAEPLNLVMAMLSGGARYVVAGITSIDDQGTGAVSARLVKAVRSGTVTLSVALHQAQRDAAAAGAPEREWALLAAYTQ